MSLRDNGFKPRPYYDKYDGFAEYDEYPPPILPPPLMDGPFSRNARYNNAYGNYRGGYGPGGGYGPMMGPPPRPWGGNFGPDRPPMRKRGEHAAIKYLLRCGVTRDNLKNLPYELLDLIEPEYCGLCALALDSFTMSKLHYVSKNHAKNTKKFLTQKMHVPLNNGERQPLRARELFCELCDVQMTSKTHAEAHYAGKPHAAIVMGRKNPKNPVLMQAGMEIRLNKLIAREKRFLNKASENKTEEAPAPKEVKPVSPELYCEICKTAVTCSEQMTMHMNGKKHLAKEKQFILKQMKGDADTTNEAEKADDNGEEDWGEPWGDNAEQQEEQLEGQEELNEEQEQELLEEQQEELQDTDSQPMSS